MCEECGVDTFSIGDKCIVCDTPRAPKHEEKTITLLAQDDTPFTTTESLLRDTVDEGSPLGRILFGPYNTNVSHGSVKLQCAPAVIPVMLELLQRGYLTQDPPMHIREKLEFYGLDVRVSLYTRLLANGTGPLQPAATVARGGSIYSIKKNGRFLFDLSRRGRFTAAGGTTQLRFIDFRSEGEKNWVCFTMDPAEDSYSVAGGEEPVVALYSAAHTKVRAATLYQEESGPGEAQVVWKMTWRQGDVGAIPESVAISSRYLALSSLGSVHVFDVANGSKVRTLSVSADSPLTLRGGKLAAKLSEPPYAGRKTCIIDIPTGQVLGDPHGRLSKRFPELYNNTRWDESGYGLTLKKSGSVLVAHNADAPQGAPQMRQIQGPCNAYACGIVGPYGF